MHHTLTETAMYLAAQWAARGWHNAYEEAFAAGVRHTAEIMLIRADWHPVTAAGLVANAEFGPRHWPVA